jgi:hypothetical protein
MNTAQAAHPNWRLKPLQTILVFGTLLLLIYGLGSFTFDYFAGGATLGFGLWPEVGGIGMFFVYVLSFYIALAVVFPILIIRRFGVGIAVYLP